MVHHTIMLVGANDTEAIVNSQSYNFNQVQRLQARMVMWCHLFAMLCLDFATKTMLARLQ